MTRSVSTTCAQCGAPLGPINDATGVPDCVYDNTNESAGNFCSEPCMTKGSRNAAQLTIDAYQGRPAIRMSKQWI